MFDIRLFDSRQPTLGIQYPVSNIQHSYSHLATNNRLNLLRSISWFATAPGSHFPQPVQSLLLKARPPEHYRFAINLQPCRNLISGLPFGSGQGDTASQGNLLRRTEG